VLRFTQKIYQAEGEDQVQWRGTIRHVQSGEETRFTHFNDATTFVQDKLSDLTLQAVEDKSPEEQTGILSKSFDFWKKVATVTPKMVMESIKDPKKQAAIFQEQIQEQLQQVGDALGQRLEDTIGQRKLEIDDWRGPSKSDFKSMLKMLEQMSEQMEALNKKVERIQKDKSKK
jgi:uncharacterized protein (DUF1697 family)